MKKIFSCCLVLLMLYGVFLPNAFPQNISLKNTVKIIYFRPNDRQPQQGIDAKLDTMIKQAQQFIADQMENHGFGRKTFQFETDASGNAVVQHLIGKSTDAYYRGNTVRKVWPELSKHVNSQNVYVTALDISKTGTCGLAVFAVPLRGMVYVPATGPCFSVNTIIHELGHNFGLYHDFRDNAYIMSYGGNRNQLSWCAAKWLDAHPYLNTHPDAPNDPIQIQLESIQDVLPDTLILRLHATDANGLHQVQLISARDELLDCKSMNGESDTVELATTGLTSYKEKSAALRLIDAVGNYRSKLIRVPEFLLPGPKIVGPWLWAVVPTGEKGGQAAATSGIDFLSYVSEGAVTEQKIATDGATLEDSVGTLQWTSAKIASSGGNNITDMVHAANLGVGDIDNHVAYGSITLVSPQQQQTAMYVGSDDAVKVWLNGTLVHNNPVNRSASDYQEAFPVTLKQGKNALLVAVYERGGGWSGFFGFKGGAKYTVMNPDGTLIPGPKIQGPKITGPWLWMIARTRGPGGAHAARSGIDFLAVASDGKNSEIQVATDGVMAGESIGNHQWTPAELSPFSSDNINTVMNATGLGVDDIDNHVAYGYIALDSPKEQQITMYAGSDDAVKVWLNGALVHKNPINRAAGDYQDEFTVTLKERTNHLLVAVYERGGRWSGFFGFENQAEYTILPYRITEPPQLKQDVNGDGTVNIQDLVLVASNLGQTGPNAADVNGDSIVNIHDLVLVAGALGASASAPSLLHPETLKMFAPADVRQWLSQAQRLFLTDPISLQGIRFLEQLLAVLIPKETALLPNYPNPFNPETWIPYQLSEPAEVTLRIYAVNGTKIRTLALGQMSAGIYQTRSRAAYWDGRNNVGEPVASGIYFYTLKAGEFTSTRKMLILK